MFKLLLVNSFTPTEAVVMGLYFISIPAVENKSPSLYSSAGGGDGGVFGSATFFSVNSITVRTIGQTPPAAAPAWKCLCFHFHRTMLAALASPAIASRPQGPTQ